MTNDLPKAFGPNYTLLKLLARGGMGEIYLARSSGMTGFEKYYAVKRLLKKFTHDNDVGARFIDEAKLGARLQHPNIVQVFDLGRVNDELFMATEFVDGFDLRRVLRFCHEKKRRIPLDIALFIVREILSGLAYAHRQVDAEGQPINLIHRDISPQNVLVSFEGEVKIIDFGLAKSTQRSAETQANVLLGNFGYMSPEQARGHTLDVRTDVYSTGIVLFELVTGTKRFVENDPLRLLEMVARPTPVMPSDRVPGMPKTIDRIYEKAAAFAAEDRYTSAETFRDDVAEALHRVNTRVSRENLAQFLNHLFLGGVAPPPVDTDLMDKSVAVRIRDLHEASAAFQRTAEQDAGDRRLHEFDDDAPQTDSHELMRSARVGDNLTHAELTGESGPQAEIEEPPTFMAVSMSAPVPAPLTVPAPVTAPVPVPASSSAYAGSPPQQDSEVIVTPHVPRVSSVPPHPSPLPPAAFRGVLLQDANVSPSPSGGASVPLGVAAPASLVPEHDSGILPLVSGTLELESDLLPPSLVFTASGLVPVPAPAPAPSPAPVAHAALAAADVVEDLLGGRNHHPGALFPSQAQQKPPVSMQPLPQPQAQPHVSPQPLTPAARSARAPQASQGQPTVVSTIAPSAKRPTEPVHTEPSIVLAPDLEPNEATVVGAMPSLHARTPAAAAARASDSGGFGGGPELDSLVIDFSSDAEPPASEPPPVIRPAAKPMGTKLTTAVAGPPSSRSDQSGPAAESGAGPFGPGQPRRR